MKPYKYTDDNNGNITFHYSYKDLKRFLMLGFENGNVGTIIISKNGKFIKYKGFGTIEKPRKIIYTITLVHHEIFDGKFDPKSIINNEIINNSNKLTIINLKKT